MSEELKIEIEKATQQAFAGLVELHPGRFYYFSLITTGEAHSPVVAAWSYEALQEAVEGESDVKDAIWGLKWSYADSPYYCFGEEYFKNVELLFGQRPDIRLLSGQERKDEFDLRLRAMEEAIAALDAKGVFGMGTSRNRIVVNVEVMPPDVSNTDRAKRLNPAEAIEEWLEEAAET